MSEFGDLLTHVPGGWFGMAVAILLVGPPTLLSKWAAGIPGFVGSAARRWQYREIGAVDREMDLTKSIDEAVEQRIAMKLKEFEQFKADVRSLRDELDAVKLDRDLAYDYIAFDAAWHRGMNIHAGEQGWVFPPPPYMTFSEFKSRSASGVDS